LAPKYNSGISPVYDFKGAKSTCKAIFIGCVGSVKQTWFTRKPCLDSMKRNKTWEGF
jgi:hypothetical protein